jgi:hypothetical protein
VIPTLLLLDVNATQPGLDFKEVWRGRSREEESGGKSEKARRRAKKCNGSLEQKSANRASF